MTAVCLKAKSSLKTETWSNIFAGFNTDSKSCLFIKQLTTTCISTILHLRKVLPDDYFEEKGFEGMTLKLLKSRKGENYVSKIEQWLEGAFEAIEKKYLKRLMLDIQDPDSNTTLEIYTMTFNYNKDNGSLNALLSTTPSFNKGGFSISNTQLNTIKLLQMCHAVTQTYSDLPSQVKLSMRLSYHENTPDNYQPRGYVTWEPVEPTFPKQARSIEIGITSTQHHFFKLFNKSCLSDKFFKDMEEELENNSTIPLGETNNVQKLKNVSYERQTKAKRELCFDNPKKSIEQKDECFDTPKKSPKKNSVVTPKKKEETLFIVSEKSAQISNKKTDEFNKKTEHKLSRTKRINVSKKIAVKTDTKTQDVRCACLLSDRTEEMFPCLGCRFLVHAECYGILRYDSTKKVRFYCHFCHQTENNLKCHDKVILSLKNASDQQKLSLLRRVLRYCNMPYVKVITLRKMEKLFSLNCPENLVNIVLNKMIETGIAVPQRRRKTHLVDKQMLAYMLPHYFYKVQNSSNSQSQTLPYSLRTHDNAKRINNFDELPVSKRRKHSATVINNFFTPNSQTSQQSCDIFC